MITTKVAIENYLLTTIDTSFDTQLNEWINGVEAEMNKLADRQLTADAVAADYKYDGNGKDRLLVDDFVAITAVKVDGTDIIADCYLYPANKTPKWKIETTSVFSEGRQNVVITGQKGYALAANMPIDLKWAATVLVAGIVNNGNNSAGEVASETIGRYTVTYSTQTQKDDYNRALAIIKNYRRIR